MKEKFVLIMLFLVFVFQVSWAQIPETISYQGVLKNANGTLVSDGTYSLTFKIYESETEGTEIWSETQSVVTTDGLFSVILGSVNPINIPFDKQYWLGITVDGGSELTPRSELTSVPYSLNTKSIPNNIVTESKIAEGAVTPDKINTSDAVSGQALMFDGTSLGWSTPPGAGLTLPFSGIASSSSDAFSITNSGSGKVIYGVNTGTGYGGYFAIDNASNSLPALSAATNGVGKAGYFAISNSNNIDDALYAETNGKGKAGYFYINNPSNSNHALSASTNGSGRACYFYINNPSNSNHALSASTNGSGNAIHGYTTGTGGAGSFHIDNQSNSADALMATTTGTGRAGYFYINNASNSKPSLYASTNGSGNAILGYTTGTGRAGSFVIYNSSNYNYALSAETNGKGTAGCFVIYNEINSEPALYAETNGTGRAGHFYGNVFVQGNLSKSSGGFVIDHPLDPENKVLSHSFIESPEMMNIYKGRSKLKDGAAVIELPDYFDALNHPESREINLTPVNGWSPLYLEGEIINNQFTVKTTKDGNPEQEFSWIIYAVRNDEYAKKHPIVVEEEKGVNNNFTKGEYLNPDVFGQ